MVVGLDIDAPFPSFGVLGPILHWIQPGLQATTPTDVGSFTLKPSAPFVANYIGPAPPPGSSPHRYIFFLYEQPESFDGQKYAPPNGANLGNMQRMRYDLDAWEREIKLGPVLAANYFKSN
jgi:phosphatidylethanolamine-binding protein